MDKPELRIIDDCTFTEVQRVKKERGGKFSANKERHSNQHLFSTLIKCKDCGWSFRRNVRIYKNTYVRWVCSGHNGRGADNCPNAVTVDEDELIEVLQEYFAGVLKAKKNVIRYVTHEFQRVYKAKDENLNYEKELNALVTISGSAEYRGDVHRQNALTDSLSYLLGIDFFAHKNLFHQRFVVHGRFVEELCSLLFADIFEFRGDLSVFEL